MICRRESTPPTRPVIVSFPGGPARPYRVQYQTAETGPAWHCYGSFHRHEMAEATARELASRGLRTRVLEFRNMPTAL